MKRTFRSIEKPYNTEKFQQQPEEVFGMHAQRKTTSTSTGSDEEPFDEDVYQDTRKKKLRVASVNKLLILMEEPLSLNDSIDSDGYTTFIDVLPDTQSSFDELCPRMVAGEIIAKFLATLGQEDFLIAWKCFGLDGGILQLQSRIASDHDISISTLERKLRKWKGMIRTIVFEGGYDVDLW